LLIRSTRIMPLNTSGDARGGGGGGGGRRTALVTRESARAARLRAGRAGRINLRGMRAKFSRKGSPLPGRTGLTTSGSSGENGTDRLEESNKRIAARLYTRERSRARRSERERERSGFNRAATANGGPACSFLFFFLFFPLSLFFSFSLSFFFPFLFLYARANAESRWSRVVSDCPFLLPPSARPEDRARAVLSHRPSLRLFHRLDEIAACEDASPGLIAAAFFRISILILCLPPPPFLQSCRTRRCAPA